MENLPTPLTMKQAVVIYNTICKDPAAEGLLSFIGALTYLENKPDWAHERRLVAAQLYRIADALMEENES